MPSSLRDLCLLSAAMCAALAGCDGSPPSAAAPAKDEGDPDVMRLIEALDHHGHVVEMVGDEVTIPITFSWLVSLGSSALPTILAVAADTDDPWIRDRLLDVIGRIGDPAGAPTLTRFLASPNPSTRSEALEALGRLGVPESQPILRDLLGQDPEVSGFERMRLLEELYRVGDHSVVADVFATAQADAGQRFAAVLVLVRHEPIRRALGLEGPYEEGTFEVVSYEQFWLAALEWHLETQGQPSPWKTAPDFAYGEPFAAEKREAFALLAEQVHEDNGRHHVLRSLPVDRDELAHTKVEPTTLVYGSGHDGSLVVVAWRPDGDAMRVHRFVFGSRRGRDVLCTYEHAAVPHAQYQRLCAGLQAIRDARVFEWWSGPWIGASSSSRDFAVIMRGPGVDVARGFSGYLGSRGRVEHTPLRVGRDWHRRFVDRHVRFQEASADESAKAVFAEVFLATHERWALDSDWWWVRERMLALAETYGTRALIPQLAKYLEADFAAGAGSDARTAVAACAALAAITGVDLRRDEAGGARPVVEVAAAYRRYLRDH